jgi:hypothetical protein
MHFGNAVTVILSVLGPRLAQRDMSKSRGVCGHMEAMPTKQEEVFRIADELVASGARVTRRAVADALGGSFREICPALRLWEERRHTETRPKSILPGRLDALGKKFCDEAWAIAEAEAAKEIDSAHRLAQDHLQRLQGEQEETIEEVQRLERVVETQAASIEKVRGDLVDALLKAERAEATRDGLQRQSDELNHRIKELTDALRSVREDEKKAHGLASELRGQVAGLKARLG